MDLLLTVPGIVLTTFAFSQACFLVSHLIGR